MIEFLQTSITPVIAFFTLLSNLLFVGVLLGMAFNSTFKNKVLELINKYILQIMFTLTASAVVGSLAYSNIVGFPPCELCWAQRILLFPQALVFFIAMLKGNRSVIKYMLPLTFIGIAIAFYQSLAHWGINSSGLDCVSVGGDCAKVYVLEYGYITIPFMSLTIFVYMAVVSLLYLRSNNAR
ncbi:MAG: disulfide bond formation protein B [Patescibacteria group bacterium]